MKQTISVYDSQRKKISIDTIKYVEGSENYSILHLTNNKPIILSRTVLRMELELPSFIRIHKRYLVNPQFITPRPPTRKELTIQLTTGEVLTVSRRRLSDILTALSGF